MCHLHDREHFACDCLSKIRDQKSRKVRVLSENQSIETELDLSKPIKALGKPKPLMGLLQGVIQNPTDIEKRAQLLSASEVGNSTPVESALLQLLDLLPGDPDFSVIDFNSIKNKKILEYCITHIRPVFTTEVLVAASFDKKFKSLNPKIIQTLKLRNSENPENVQVTLLAEGDRSIDAIPEKQLALWIETVVMPIGVKVPASMGSLILQRCYQRMDAGKKQSSGVIALFEAVVKLLTSPPSVAELDAAISGANEMGPAAFAKVLLTIENIKFSSSSPKGIFLHSLLKPRDRKTVTVLAQEGVFDSFTLEELGELLSCQPMVDLIRRDERTTSAVFDECKKRLRKTEISMAHFWLLKWPAVREWITDAQILQRLRPESDPLSRLLFEDGRTAGRIEGHESVLPEIENLKSETKDLKNQILESKNQLMIESKRASEFEERLRRSRNSSIELRDDETKLIKVDSLRQLISVIENLTLAAGSEAALQDALRVARSNLKQLGVRVLMTDKTSTPFDPMIHEGPNCKAGDSVRIVSAAYLLELSGEEVVIQKAKVLPA